MMAGVNNDSLAELLLATALLGTVAILQRERPPSFWALGLLLGAIFVTKSQAYVAAPVLGLALFIRWKREGSGVDKLFRWGAELFLPALLIGALWWGRNISIYGGLDWMGLQRHDLVVTGQPTTAEWVATHGLPATLRRFIQFTYQSFWGMFGWMTVPMNLLAYQMIGLWSFLTLCGFGLALSGRRGRPVSERVMRSAVLLLALSAALSAAGYLWWNLGYVQHQGRYLYPALIPLGLAAGVAWERLARAKSTRLIAACMLLIAVAAIAMGHRTFAVLTLGTAGLLWLNTRLPTRLRWLLPAAVAAGMAALSALSLYLFVIPWLS
jgi:hypothetical protein